MWSRDQFWREIEAFNNALVRRSAGGCVNGRKQHDKMM